ncbi:hypothetical protein ACJMK2_007921 [Sinanodonta woodiana]|uniref:Dynamin N-terminal domain-containing protein n=1 Tax=Sinanodonta woodiana TaxID=1069815 RepID=A0ABD3VMG4_SINWO
MASRQNITSGDIRQRLEEAGDDYPKLLYMIIKCKLVEDNNTLPSTAQEAKQLIQRVLDTDEKAMKERFKDLEITMKLLIPTLANGRKLETKTDDLYRKTIEALQSHDISQFLICLLDVHILDYNDILHKRSAALDQAEVRIMVIGETCAGKSTVMNLLMAGNYLPVYHGECTRVTCELKASKYRRAAIHYDEK